MRASVLLFFLIQISPLVGIHAETQPEDSFRAGLRLYQEKNYKEATEQFRMLYDSNRESASILYNWGLSSYQQQQRGLAAALWRRSLYLDPEMSAAAKALDFLAAEMPTEVFEPNFSGLQLIQHSLLKKFNVHKILFVTLILLATSCFLFLRYIAQRQKALKLSLPHPRTPVIALTLLVGFILSLGLSALKIRSLFEVHATVISSTAVVRTGPSEEDNTLFELLEGFEVIVRDIKDRWVHVRLPEGTAGWVHSGDLFQHSGKERLW